MKLTKKLLIVGLILGMLLSMSGCSLIFGMLVNKAEERVDEYAVIGGDVLEEMLEGMDEDEVYDFIENMDEDDLYDFLEEIEDVTGSDSIFGDSDVYNFLDGVGEGLWEFLDP